MGLIRRKGAQVAKSEGSSDDGFNNLADAAAGGTADPDMNAEAQEVIKDNLEVMYDIVMQIREDEDFAKDIYKNCPRLQHMLDQRPDLRVVFEDPHLVRINFEQVYRDQGGVLPEDEPEKPSCLSKVVNHPLFKVFKVLLFVKKIMNCVFGGGFALIKGFFTGLCVDEAAEQLADGAGGDGDGGGNGDGGGDQGNPQGPEGNPANAANKEALNKAADHMEDPEVQEQMQELLENDPEDLQDAIENDPELRELRDSSPFVAELMSEPETMKILTDPENLRALGEAPDLIEADFADPDWVAPDDIETGVGAPDPEVGMERGGGAFDTGMTDFGTEMDAGFEMDSPEVDFDAEGGDLEAGEAEAGEVEVEAEGEGEGEGDGGEEEEEGNMVEDFELGDAEESGGNNQGGGGNKGKQQQKSKQQQQNNEGGGGGGGFLAQVGAGITDMLAAEIVGVGVSELTGGGDDFPVDDGAADAADAAEGAAVSASAVEDAATQAAAVSEAAEVVMSDDVMDNMDNLEDGMDEIEDTHDERQEENENRNAERAKAGAAGAAGGAAAGYSGPDSNDKSAGDEDGEEEEEEEDEEEEPEKKSRFGFIGNMASKISTAAKEHVATSLLGDDLGEMFVEKIEEDEEEEEDEEGDDDDSKASKDSKGKKDEKDEATAGESEEKEETKRRGLFRRNR